MIKHILAAAAITVALLAPARADYIIKDGNGVVKTIKAGTISGTIQPYSTPTDSTGIPYSAANPLAVVFGNTVLLPSFATPQHFICDSGCSGGGGGGGLTVPYATPIGAYGTPGGFKDSSGNFQALLGDTTNGQWVSLKASVPLAVTGTFWQTTQPVSLASLPAFAATPTFNLGTLNGAATAANQVAVQGSAAPGTAASIADLVAGIYNSSPPSLSNGQQAALQLDSAGSLRVNVVTTVGGAGGGTSSNFAAAFPTAGTAAGMSQGGNMVAMTGTSGNLNVQCANCSGSGVSTADGATFTAGSSVFAGAGGIYQTTSTTSPMTNGQQGLFQMTINRAQHTNLRNAVGVEVGVAATPLQVSLANTAANGTALLVNGAGGTFPVSQAVAANLNATVVNAGTFAVQATIATPTAWGVNALGSTTSGQSGHLGLGAVTTAAPSYTTGQSNALSLTLAGALRIDGSGVTQPVSMAANQSINVSQINGVTPLMGNGVTGTGVQRVTIASDNTAFTVNAAQSGAWNITNVSGTVSLPTGASTSALQTSGNSSLSSIDTKTPALGQALAAASTPVVLTAIQMTALTPLATVATTVANGADVALGTTTDAVASTPSTGSAATLIALAKSINNNVSSPIPAGTAIIGYTSNDPCTYATKNNLNINQNGTSSVQLVALSGSTKIYVCSLSLMAAGATTVAITTGTGTACVTGNAAVIGTTTANIANSMAFPANGGMTLGSGAGTIAAGAAAGELCMILGSNVYVSGNLTYVQQ